MCGQRSWTSGLLVARQVDGGRMHKDGTGQTEVDGSARQDGDGMAEGRLVLSNYAPVHVFVLQLTRPTDHRSREDYGRAVEDELVGGLDLAP